jgi:hypothetical protein
MKTYQSKVENIWEQTHKIVYTEQEQLIIDSENEEDKVARKEIMELYKHKKRTPLNEIESARFIEVYKKNKPTLKETDKYELIAINVVENGKKTSGIINYRLNGEHKQIRF